MRAIFLGSFNPPHNGHVNCIKSVINSGYMKDLNIDKIHIIPCYQNPNKSQVKDPDWNFWQRYKLCTLEFSGLSEFVVIDDIEMLINKTDCNKSYTYNLINYFKGGHDGMIKSDFWWIITIETYKELLDGKWYHSEELLANNKFIVVYNNKTDLDMIMDTWENAGRSSDILSQKQSDATLGYERVYDTESGDYLKAENGFTDWYDGSRYLPADQDDAYLSPVSGTIIWK